MVRDKAKITPVEEMLRKQAALPALKRFADDKARAPSLAPYLETIEAMLFQHQFDVAVLWRTHCVRDNNEGSKFSSQLGIRPSAYIAECRLRIAGRLLHHTCLIAVRIGELVGYSTPRTFWRAFKSWSGRTPEQYRLNPDPDPDPWEAPVDPSRISDALEGRLSLPQRRTLCRQLGDLQDTLVDSFEPPGLDELLYLADRSKTVDDEIRYLERAARHSEAAGRQAELSGKRAVAIHCRGTYRTLASDIDRGYEDLTQAHALYSAAGILAPHIARRRQCLNIQAPSSTEGSLLSALCPDCRGAIVQDTGLTIRRHLGNALALVPLDLEWFRVCCEQCYNVTWRAFALARHGHLPNALQAWWLAAHADLENFTVPSVGRVIAALDQVDSSRWSSQEDRLIRCNLAHDDARLLGRTDLLLTTRFWRGNVRRALARIPEAREDLQLAGNPSPWLQALHAGFMGLLKEDTNNYDDALEFFEAAEKIYATLDPHIAALLVNERARVCAQRHDYEAAIRLYRQTLVSVDQRRGSLVQAGVKINLARALAGFGDSDQARKELAKCQYDRDAYPQFFAVEVFTRGCIALLAGDATEAYAMFADAKCRFESLGEAIHAALSSMYSVEAAVALGRFEEAATAANDAMRFFEAALCPLATLEAAARLRAVLGRAGSAGQVATTVQEIAATVRDLAVRHGGGLILMSPSQSH